MTRFRRSAGRSTGRSTWAHRARLVTLALVVVLCAVMTVTTVHDQRELDRRGIVAPARVVRVHVEHSGRSSTRYLDVAIPGLPGAHEVSDYDGEPSVGDVVTLRYLPGDPDTNEQDGHRMTGDAWFMSALAAGGAVLVVVELRDGPRAHRRPASSGARGRHRTGRHRA
ncbi:hypothetical protein [Luteimicrobium sp. DT211]|uniref:hypothetical protein n=1 Tax=Luteimicrobium sp. DT211 TaxID=3393412 RepID=UPI003CE8133D